LDPNWINQNYNEPKPKVANFDRMIMDKMQGQPATSKQKEIQHTKKRELQIRISTIPSLSARPR
jgi:hypothetical protein